MSNVLHYARRSSPILTKKAMYLTQIPYTGTLNKTKMKRALVARIAKDRGLSPHAVTMRIEDSHIPSHILVYCNVGF